MVNLAHRSRVHPRARRDAGAFALLCALALPACSLLLELDPKQCEVDADCLNHGLKDAVCIQSLCQAAGGTDSGTSTSPDTGTTPPPPTGGTQAAGGSGAAAGSAAHGGSRADAGREAAGSSAVGSAGAPDSGSAGSGGGAAPAAGSGGHAGDAAVSGQGGSAGAGGCGPKGCPECKSNQDCDQRGVVNGVCSGGICYAAPPQCNTDQDCVSRGPEFEGGRCLMTQCLPNPMWRCEPPPPPVDGETRQITVPVIDAFSLRAVSGVDLVACDKRDLNCTRPAAMTKTGSDGHAVFTLPTNFGGYLQEMGSLGYMPAMYFLPALIPDDGVLEGFPMMSPGLMLDGLATALGSRIDSTRGHLILVSLDCFRKPVANVVFSSPQADKGSTIFYISDGLPRNDVTSTRDAGQGGILNFPAGTATVALKQAKDGLMLNEVTLLVRAGYITVAFIPPQWR